MTRLGTAAALAALTILAVPSISAEAQVSGAVRNACENKANKVTPPLRAGEREAYITNCIADAAPAPSASKKRKY